MAKQRSSASMWRLRGYLRPYRARFIVMFFLAGIGIGAAIVIPLVTKAVIDGPIANSNPRGLLVLGLFAIGLGVVEAFLIFLRRWIVSKGTNGVETGIRLDLYDKLQRLPTSFHSRWQSGQLLSRIMNDLATVRRFLGFGLLFIVMNVVQIAVVTALLINMYWPLGLVVLGSTVPITLMCLRNERAYTRLSRKIQDQIGDVASRVEEGAYGIRVVKSFGRASHVVDPYDGRSHQVCGTSMERVRIRAGFWPSSTSSRTRPWSSCSVSAPSPPDSAS